MLQEIILVLGCIKGSCEATRYTYLSYNPEIKGYIKTVEKNARNYIPESFPQELVPILVAGYNKEFKLPINKNISISYKDETVSTKLVYGVNF